MVLCSAKPFSSHSVASAHPSLLLLLNPPFLDCSLCYRVGAILSLLVSPCHAGCVHLLFAAHLFGGLTLAFSHLLLPIQDKV